MVETPATAVEVKGVMFLAEVTSPATSKPLFLGGAGVRGIEVGGKFIAVTVIGVYLEEAAIPVITGKWKGKAAEELGGTVEFYRDIATGPFEKLTRVTMLLPLTGQQYSEKVAENCVAEWIAADTYTEEEEAAITNFLEIFKPRSFSPGSSIIFTHSPHGTLTIGFLEDGGVPVAAEVVIENKKLTNTVLESIIGEHGVSPAAKQSLARRISELLHKEEEDVEEIVANEKGTNSVNVVALGSIEIFNAHEWFPSKPSVYFHCQGEENKTVLPDVKKAHVFYTFKGEESWQPLTVLPNKKCKRCGFYEKDTFKSDDVFDEWEFCPADFVDGKYVRFKENEFNATFFCPNCTASADSDEEQSQNTATKHNKRNLVLIVVICALASLIVMVGMVASYKYWQKRRREHDQLRTAHKLTGKLRREVILGSSSLDDPSQFIKKLKLLSSKEASESAKQMLVSNFYF